MFTARSGGSTVLCSLSAWAVLGWNWRHWFCLQGCPGCQHTWAFLFAWDRMSRDLSQLLCWEQPQLCWGAVMGTGAFPALCPMALLMLWDSRDISWHLRGSAGAALGGSCPSGLGLGVNTDGQGPLWGCQSLLSPAFMPCRSCSLYWNGNKNGSQLPREISETVCCRKVSIYVQKKTCWAWVFNGWFVQK